MIRTDRMEALAGELARLVETQPLPPGSLPPMVATLERAARMLGLDLMTQARAMVAGSLRSLPSQASADPARADAVAAWLAHLLAWLTDQRDDPPPAELPL